MVLDVLGDSPTRALPPRDLAMGVQHLRPKPFGETQALVMLSVDAGIAGKADDVTTRLDAACCMLLHAVPGCVE